MRRPQGRAVRPRPAAGPAQQQIVAVANLQLARSMGNLRQQFDAQYRLMRANQRLQRAQQQLAGPGPGPSLSDRLARLVASTRVGMGRGGGMNVMPLIGQLTNAVGATGKMGLAMTIATSVVEGFGDALRSASGQMKSLSDAATVSGGTTGQVATLAALGFKPEDIAGRAAGFRQQIGPGGDPQAMMAAGRLGIGLDPGRMFGSTNEARMLLDAAQTLARIQDPNEQLRTARAWGMEGDLPAIRKYANNPALGAEAARQQAIMSDENIRLAKEFNAQMDLFTMQLQTFGMQVGVTVMSTLKWLDDATNALSEMIRNALKSVGITVPGAAAKPSPQQQALAANTQATMANTAALQAGFSGGGANARGAIPSALRGDALRQSLQGDRLKLGAFTL